MLANLAVATFAHLVQVIRRGLKMIQHRPGLGAIAALIVTFKCQRPTREQMDNAVRAAPDNAPAPKQAIA